MTTKKVTPKAFGKRNMKTVDGLITGMTTKRVKPKVIGKRNMKAADGLTTGMTTKRVKPKAIGKAIRTTTNTRNGMDNNVKAGINGEKHYRFTKKNRRSYPKHHGRKMESMGQG